MKKLLFLFLTLAGSLAAFSFDWPQKEIASNSFHSYFGQLRGGTLGNSIVFKESSPVKSADQGTIVCIIKEHDESMGWFESPLGNAVIINHHNQLSSVYGNIDKESMNPELEKKFEIEKSFSIGESGNSGWQEGSSCLEFQVYDTKNKSSVNPRILMPRIGQELELWPGDLFLVDRNGNNFNLSDRKYLKSGNYALYRSRQITAVPYRTTVYINGASMENIYYDTLRESEGRLCLVGNGNYPVDAVYPDSTKQLLGFIRLTRGQNSLSVSLSDILGSVKSASYLLIVN